MIKVDLSPETIEEVYLLHEASGYPTPPEVYGTTV
jgi:hypothetical protein